MQHFCIITNSYVHSQTHQKHPLQADELPMLVCGGFIWYCTLPTEKMTPRQIQTRVCMMSAYILAVCAVYVYSANPLLHQLGYGAVIAFITFNSFRSAKELDYLSISGRLGVFCFLFGFFLWNLDNIYCDLLRSTRHEIVRGITDHIISGQVGYILGSTVASPLQLHAWWHIWTSLGAYHTIFYFQWCRFVRGSGPSLKTTNVKWLMNLIPIFVLTPKPVATELDPLVHVGTLKRSPALRMRGKPASLR